MNRKNNSIGDKKALSLAHKILELMSNECGGETGVAAVAMPLEAISVVVVAFLITLARDSKRTPDEVLKNYNEFLRGLLAAQLMAGEALKTPQSAAKPS